MREGVPSFPPRLQAFVLVPATVFWQKGRGREWEGGTMRWVLQRSLEHRFAVTVLGISTVSHLPEEIWS